MKVLITAGPTREPIDTVRFISNASSGLMGFAVAEAAAQACHDVTLLAGPVALEPPQDVTTKRFTTFSDLQTALTDLFPQCDVLIMSAAVGDFTVENTENRKISRRNGPITLNLIPTEDILGGLGKVKSASQVIISFAVEDGPTEEIISKAREEMKLKNADYCVVNTPAAMAAGKSSACILARGGLILEWNTRSKKELANEIIKLLR